MRNPGVSLPGCCAFDGKNLNSPCILADSNVGSCHKKEAFLMKKRYLGIALAALVGGAFVACGSGDVSKPTSDDEMLVFGNDSTYYSAIIKDATASCTADPACASKLNGTSSVAEESSSSSAGIVEPGSSPGSSSSAAPLPGSSSTLINFSSASVPASSATAGVSSSSIADDGTVNGTCAPVPATIEKGTATTWTFTVDKNLGMNIVLKSSSVAYSWAMPNSEELSAEETGLKNTSATYKKSGDFSATLVVDGNTVQCSPLHVNGAKITGCECSADASTVDVASGSATAKWTISGCTTDATITGYTWTGATGSETSATATLSKKGESVAPTVTVKNDDNTEVSVTCPAVKATDSSAPEYEIDKTGITIPSGSCGTVTVAGNLRINTAGWQATDCSIVLTIGSNQQEKTFTNCNFSNELPTAVNVGDQACVEITGAESVKVVITEW